VKRINKLHESEEREKVKIINNLIELNKIAKEEKQKILDEMSYLCKEVERLEKRKTEALKPIKDTQAQAEDALERAKSTLSALEKRKTELDAFNEKNLDLAEELSDKEHEILHRDDESKRKSDIIIEEEKKLKKSAEKLSKEWVEYHKTVNEKNVELIRREREIENARIANENFRKILERRDREQLEHDRQIRDKYATLARSIERLKK